jgi:hypothetical protein
MYKHMVGVVTTLHQILPIVCNSCGQDRGTSSRKSFHKDVNGIPSCLEPLPRSTSRRDVASFCLFELH